MAVTGRKPKEDGAKINNHPPTHEWIDVVNTPYRGGRPQLPKDTPGTTRAWWSDVTTLPHCLLWHRGDWRFALDTARVHAAFAGGDLARAGELRIREAKMGTTADALRDLRIRYVEPVADAVVEQPAVDFAAERRKRLTDAS